MLKTQPGMKEKEEEEEENNKDLWEIGALNLLIAPLHIPLLPRKFRVVEEGACVLLVLKEGKGREKGKREGKKLWGGRERELWCKV
jgi:hypothetical protein